MFSVLRDPIDSLVPPDNYGHSQCVDEEKIILHSSSCEVELAREERINQQEMVLASDLVTGHIIN